MPPEAVMVMASPVQMVVLAGLVAKVIFGDGVTDTVMLVVPVQDPAIAVTL